MKHLVWLLPAFALAAGCLAFSAFTFSAGGRDPDRAYATLAANSKAIEGREHLVEKAKLDYLYSTETLGLQREFGRYAAVAALALQLGSIAASIVVSRRIRPIRSEE